MAVRTGFQVNTGHVQANYLAGPHLNKEVPMIALLLTAVFSPYLVTYCPGGETPRQAMKRVGGVEVIGGGYYAKAKGVRHSIDLVMIEGEVIIPYRKDLARPVLVIEKSGKIRLDHPYKPTPEDWHAIGGAKVPTDAYRRRGRQIVGINGNQLKFYRMTGTYRECERRIKLPHLYMDGGSSVNPWVKLPSHIVRLK